MWTRAKCSFLAQHGFEVTAVDQNELVLEILQSIVEQEDLEMTVGLYDINSANLKQSYDLIVSTVVPHVLASGSHSGDYSKYARPDQSRWL